MFLQTHESWERKTGLESIFGDDGFHNYPVVRVFLNVLLFHVDVLPKSTDEDLQIWSRYIFAERDEVLKFLESMDAYKEVIISLQTRRSDSGDEQYWISTITEIIEAKDEADQRAFIYCCQNGKRYLDSDIRQSEDELSHKKTIYYQKAR